MIDRIKHSIDNLHLDIMDGHFVPRITFGQHFVEDLRSITKLQLDIHLMISNPEKQLESFMRAGGDRIIVHFESVKDFDHIKNLAESHEKQLGLSISPNTPFTNILPYVKDIDSVLIMTVHPGFSGQELIPNTLDKIKEAEVFRTENSLDFHIMVDGGINLNTARDVIKAGAEILVIGTGLFSTNDPLKEIERFRSLSELDN
jgi:ribulose-phosphate 3-epimerase